MVIVETISIVLTGLGIMVALTYYTLTLRNTSKARQRELMFQRLQGYSLEYMRTFAHVRNFTDWDDAEDWEERYGILVNPEAWAKYAYIMRIYNLAGILLKEKVADVDLIFQLYPANAVIRMWEQFEPIIRNRRERLRHPTFFEPFEFLYNEAKKMYPDIPPLSQVP